MRWRTVVFVIFFSLKVIVLPAAARRRTASPSAPSVRCRKHLQCQNFARIQAKKLSFLTASSFCHLKRSGSPRAATRGRSSYRSCFGVIVRGRPSQLGPAPFRQSPALVSVLTRQPSRGTDNPVGVVHDLVHLVRNKDHGTAAVGHFTERKEQLLHLCAVNTAVGSSKIRMFALRYSTFRISTAAARRSTAATSARRDQSRCNSLESAFTALQFSC